MNVEITVPEVVEIFKEIQAVPEKLFEMMRLDIRKIAGDYLSALMASELSAHLGRGRYERCKVEFNHRNGSYPRKFTIKGIGEVGVKVPRDRNATFKTTVLPSRKQYEEAVGQDLSIMFLAGISTRSLSMISKHLIGRKISHTEISNANKELTEAVERWRSRDLCNEPIKYLFIDGVNFDMRVDGSIEKVPVLVVIGVTEQGHKMVLAVQSGDKESATTWRELFKDLKRRGLKADQVILGIMDGLSGLEKVFKEEFQNARVQRCQVHVARNVLAKVPRKLKEAVADEMRSIFYASSKKKALQFFEQFKDRWEKELPSAVATLERSLESCLSFMQFPEDEWISLRTSNIVERLNKEFKRRTKQMEILAGEASCYRLLAFISLRMELHWRANPVGRVRKNLPFFHQFTQES
ncbi:MAG: IS256 family transposase [Desulfobacteraceae bacterium]|jgi:putative transposase